MMDNMEVASAREIEASLRERLDTESIAVVREAAGAGARPTGDSDVGAAASDVPDGELTDPGLTVSDYEVGRSDEVIVSTETDEANPDATQLFEREPSEEETVRPEELAAADVVPEQSEAQEEQPTQVLRAEDMEPLADEPGVEEEPEVEEPEIEPSTAQDETRQVDEPPVSEPGAAAEVEREEPALAEERSSQEFFDRDEEERGDSRIFRASRFLRRRE